MLLVGHRLVEDQLGALLDRNHLRSSVDGRADGEVLRHRHDRSVRRIPDFHSGTRATGHRHEALAAGALEQRAAGVKEKVFILL